MNDDELEIMLDEFRADMELTLENGTDEDSLNEKILAFILLLFMLGSGYEEEEELTGEDREWLDEMFRLTFAAVPGIVNRANDGVDIGPTAERVTNHSLGAYEYALMVNGASGDEILEWEMGPTEHCGDCYSYAALGPRPAGEWEVIARERNHYPQSPDLQCKGLHCQCRMRRRG